MILGNDYENYESGTFRSCLQQQHSMPAIAWNLFKVPFISPFTNLPMPYYYAEWDEAIPADDLLCAYCAGGEL